MSVVYHQMSNSLQLYQIVIRSRGMRVNVCCLPPNEQFFTAISVREQVVFR